MKKKEKKRILILVAVVIVIIVALLIVRAVLNNKNDNSTTQTPSSSSSEAGSEYTALYSDGSKLNVSSKLKENKTYQNVTISNIQLTTVNGLNRLLASVTNNSNSRTDAQDISLVFVDNQGNTIATVPGVIPAMNAGETAQLNASTTKDIINAYDFRIE